MTDARGQIGLALIMRAIVFVLAIFVVGVIAVMGLQFVEPISQVTGAPASLGWGSPGYLGWMVVGALGLLLVVTIWFVTAPIRTDSRQQFR